ncbi:hypothetical protein ACFW5G_22460 [Streptomyces griseoaurantiacus]|uniref:hypothetical protein n=1 Tax=Streptomyces griseoaurantiacus TaxID=68213 RepID=UPI00367C0A55
MPLADCFSAPDDEAALAVPRTEGGPRRTGHDPVRLRGVDPVLALVRLEAAVTGCGHEEAGARRAADRSCRTRRTARRSWSP